MNISNDVLQNTLLNKIIPDLWPIIEEYFRTFPKFVIGSYDVEYPGYRMIEENDLNHKIFIDELAYFYRTNKGFPSVDDFYGNVLFCRNKILRTPIDPQFTFQTDPVRIMRAVYYSILINNIISY